MDERARVKLGSFGRAHGVRGEVRLFLYNPQTELLDEGLSVFVPAAPEELRTLTVERARPTDKFYIIAFAEIDDRDAAERLTNLEVEVDPDALPEPDEDEVYQRDLVGLPVALIEEDSTERTIGEIAGFLMTGANDVMIVDIDDGERLLVPVIDEAIAVLTPEEGAVLEPLDRWAPEDTDL